jgi:hypothetical protein
LVAIDMNPTYVTVYDLAQELPPLWAPGVGLVVVTVGAGTAGV